MSERPPAEAPKKSGGIWGAIKSALSNISVTVNVVPQAPTGNPADPAARMEPVRSDRQETYNEMKFRTTDGREGQAPMVRVDRERQHVARSLDTRTKPAGGEAATIPHGAGAPLSKDVRARMETQLGSDLSGVKVHTGGDSEKAAEGFGAKAFTVGQDVHFGSGQYAPGTKEGDRLLAHELTHTVQGVRSGVQRKAEDGGGAAAHHDAGGEQPETAAHDVSQPGEPAEKEADAVADQVADKLHGDSEGGAKDAKASPGKEQAPQIGAKLWDGRVLRKKGDKPPAGSSGKNTPPASASKPPSPAAAQGPAKGARVDTPVPGLMGSIDPMSTPTGWTFKDSFPAHPENPNLVSVVTDVVDPQGRKGMVQRGYDKAKKQFVMMNAFLITPGEDKSTGVQNFIEHKEPTMIKGKGTPTQTFLTLRQMKILEKMTTMKTAALEKVKMSTIQNVEAILQLEQHKRAGLELDKAVMKTESKKYAETTLVQAGKRIVSGKVVGGAVSPIESLLQWFEKGKANRQENFNKLLATYGINRGDPVLWNYNIEFDVEDFGKGAVK